jgi:ribose transport system permease protein
VILGLLGRPVTANVALIGNGFTLLAWNPPYEQITLGVILLLAVGGDAWSRLRTT